MRAFEFTPTDHADLYAISPLGSPGSAAGGLGWFCNRSVGSDGPLPGAVGGSSLVVWSGGLGEGLFDADPRTWMSPGWAALSEALPRWLEKCEGAGIRPVLRPHARHVMSDAPGIARVLREFPGVRVLLDPAAMLTANMIATAEDHFTRTLSSLGHHERVMGVVMANVLAPAGAASDTDDGPPLRRVALDRGVLDGAMIRRLVEEYVPEHVPRVMEGG